MREFDATSPRSDFHPRTQHGKWKSRLLGLGCLVIVLAFATNKLRKDANNLSAINLPKSVSQAALEEAHREFIELFKREPDEADLMMALAETAVRNKQPDVAIQCFARIPSAHIRYGTSVRFQEAQVLLQANRVEKAEASFREFLTLQENRPSFDRKRIRTARAWLAFLLTIELRFEERKLLLQQLVQNGEFDVYDAKQLYFPSLSANYSTEFSSRLGDFLEQDPTCRPLLIAQARYLVRAGKLKAADQLLQSLRLQYPKDSQILAATLECLFEMVDWKRFESVISNAPNFKPDEPWLLTQMRAEFARYSADWPTAEMYFRQVLESDPANPTCHMGLASALYSLGKTDERKTIQARALTLAKIRVYLSAVNQKSQGGSRALAKDAKSMGMFEAAQSFELLAEQIAQGAR